MRLHVDLGPLAAPTWRGEPLPHGAPGVLVAVPPGLELLGDLARYVAAAAGIDAVRFEARRYGGPPVATRPCPVRADKGEFKRSSAVFVFVLAAIRDLYVDQDFMSVAAGGPRFPKPQTVLTTYLSRVPDL